MTYEQYRMVFYIGLSGTGIFLLAAAVLYFALGIPAAVEELSGRAAKKAVEKMQERQRIRESGTPGISEPVTIPLEQKEQVTEELSPENQTVILTEAQCTVLAEVTYIHTDEHVE